MNIYAEIPSTGHATERGSDGPVQTLQLTASQRSI